MAVWWIILGQNESPHLEDQEAFDQLLEILRSHNIEMEAYNARELLHQILTGAQISAVGTLQKNSSRFLSMKEATKIITIIGRNYNVKWQKESKCFIATAACGTEHAEEILQLQAYRDKVLKPKKWGRIFITIYEFISPTIARLVDCSNIARTLVRNLIVRPILILIKYWKEWYNTKDKSSCKLVHKR